MYSNINDMEDRIASILLENRKILFRNIDLITLDSNIDLLKLMFKTNNNFNYKTMELLRNCESVK